MPLREAEPMSKRYNDIVLDVKGLSQVPGEWKGTPTSSYTGTRSGVEGGTRVLPRDLGKRAGIGVFDDRTGSR